MIIAFLIVSYGLFTNGRLATTSKIASAFDMANLDFMINYSQSSNNEAINETLDSGTLAIRNPNKNEVNATVNMLINEDADLENIKFIVNGNELKAVKENYHYIITVDSRTFNPYEDAIYKTEIEGYTTSYLTYTFDVIESF